MNPRREPPMPLSTVIELALRNDEPVARISFFDLTDDSRQMDFSPRVALALLTQLAQFLDQIGVYRS